MRSWHPKKKGKGSSLHLQKLTDVFYFLYFSLKKSCEGGFSAFASKAPDSDYLEKHGIFFFFSFFGNNP